MPANTPVGYVGVAEAIRRLGIAPRTFWNYVKAGKLSTTKNRIGKCTLVPIADIDVLLTPVPRP